MARARVSTTVDAGSLDRARRLGVGRDSELFDAALVALIESVEHERERRALSSYPYHLDDDLDVVAAPVDWDVDLPYDGGVPDEVIRLARERRARRA